MGERQRLIIGNLTQYGMVEEADALDLPPNAFQLIKNLAFYQGRLGTAGRWGALSSATPIFNGSTYNCCDLWQLYNSTVLKLKAGDFAEYEGAGFLMYEIPCWLGLFGSNSSGVITGTAYDANWSTATFPRAPNKWLTKNDKVFLSSLATAEFAEHFTDLTTAYAIAVTGITTAPTAGATYHVDGSPTPIYTVISTGLTGSAPNISGTLYINGASAPAASSHIDKDSGTGDAAITYTYTAANNVVRLNTYTEWADSSNTILQSNTIATYADTAYNASLANEGLAFNSGAIAAVTNQFFTIRKIKLLGEGANASLIVRDNTTKRGYALQVEQTSTAGNCYTFTVIGPNGYVPPATGDVYTRPNGTEFTVVGFQRVSATAMLIYTTGAASPGGDPGLIPGGYNTLTRKTGYSGGSPIYRVTGSVITTGPMTVTLRLWDGYFASTDTEVGQNATVVWEKTGITDWGDSTYNDVHYEDLWMWWRDSFITFGYGPNAMGCVTISATPAAARVGFALKYAYIGAKSGTYSCIYSYAITKTGPYAISAFADATSVTITSPPANGTYLIWASKYANRKKIVTSSDYVLFVNDSAEGVSAAANFPVSIWRGGMTEEVPLTNPAYVSIFAYAANDIAIYKGRVFLAGARRLVHKYGANGCFEWVNGFNTPTLVKWSSPFYPNVWEDQYPSGTTGDMYRGAGHIDFAETNGTVNAIGQLRDVLVVYKEDSIALLSPTGISADPFSVDYIAWNIGVTKPRSIAITPERHFIPKPEGMWQVDVGEVTKTPVRYSVGDEGSTNGQAWVIPSENTVYTQAYYLGDLNNLCLAYNYQTNSTFYAELKALAHLVESKACVYGITSAGLYVYASKASNTILTSYICGDTTGCCGLATQALTAVLSMGDLVNSKTIYNVDVFTRHRGTTQSIPSAASLDIRVVCGNTAEADYTTVAGEIVGKEPPHFVANTTDPINDVNLWRFRYNKILTGLTFQVDIRLNTSYLTHEIVRIEIDYEPHGLSKQA